MTTRKPRLLLTNDDGIDAPGIQALRAALRDDYELHVVAPMREKSGAGCSLSLADEMEVDVRMENGVTWGHAVDGTPADCVKFAVTALKQERPDFVLSGINRGMNAGNSVFYSGTVAATIEATLFGLPAMACSLACWGYPESYYEDAAQVVASLVPWLLRQPPRPRTFWNLNVPNRRLHEIRGIRATTHGTSFFVDDFVLHRSEGGASFYRNIGTKLVGCTRNPDADDRCVEQGHASLSLLSTDLTVSLPEAAKQDLERDWHEHFSKARPGHAAHGRR